MALLRAALFLLVVFSALLPGGGLWSTDPVFDSNSGQGFLLLLRNVLVRLLAVALLDLCPLHVCETAFRKLHNLAVEVLLHCVVGDHGRVATWTLVIDGLVGEEMDFFQGVVDEDVEHLWVSGSDLQSDVLKCVLALEVGWSFVRRWLLLSALVSTLLVIAESQRSGFS